MNNFVSKIHCLEIIIWDWELILFGNQSK